jgi:hypothetical protein
MGEFPITNWEDFCPSDKEVLPFVTIVTLVNALATEKDDLNDHPAIPGIYWGGDGGLNIVVDCDVITRDAAAAVISVALQRPVCIE